MQNAAISGLRRRLEASLQQKVGFLYQLMCLLAAVGVIVLALSWRGGVDEGYTESDNDQSEAVHAHQLYGRRYELIMSSLEDRVRECAAEMERHQEEHERECMKKMMPRIQGLLVKEELLKWSRKEVLRFNDVLNTLDLCQMKSKCFCDILLRQDRKRDNELTRIDAEIAALIANDEHVEE